MSIDWQNLARASPLAILVDLDGTLIPLAPTPDEAVLDDEAVALVRAVAGAHGVRVIVVSGRPRWMMDALAVRAQVDCVAEHGTWQWHEGAWHQVLPSTPELDDLEGALRALVGGSEGALVERKDCSVAVHWRVLANGARDALIDAVDPQIDEWLESHPDFERLAGAEMIEVRHRSAHKGTAVAWARRQSPGARVLAIGDDVSDEDMFRSLGGSDVGVVVGSSRPSAAAARVEGVNEVRALLRWVASARRADAAPVPPSTTEVARRRASGHGLVVVSNRLPSQGNGRTREVGGLVSALGPALAARDGLWLGWSGREREPGLVLHADADTGRAHFDYPPGWRQRYYAGFCNQALWPLLHGFTTRARFVDDEWRCYRDVNAAYARLVRESSSADAAVWGHDYQLLLAGAELRKTGHTGRLGLFVHVPFPPRDDFEVLPWSADVLEAMLAFDVIGFHTQRWADNFRLCVRGALGRDAGDRVGVFPIGIEPDAFASAAADKDADDVARLRAMLRDTKLVLGVDRLDYSKGIPERLEAFARFLELRPDWRGKVSFVQVSVPSRSDVPDYAELRRRVENLVGHINGLHGEADWVPVRYLYRSYDQRVLAQLYRAADVAMVTPLRDGMNLVAKEFVASQDDADPGVLLLSKFAGAAEEMDAAVLTNPHHRDGVAADLARALAMPLDERCARQARLREVVLRTTAASWAESFLRTLGA